MKKFLSLALALIMVLSLVACGDTASDNTDNSNTDANTEQTGEIKGLTAEERAKEFITVGTGPTSGIYFPIGGAFATALKEYGYQTSAEATNATGQNILLKLIEEGPEYACFLFLSPNPELLLETIRSRCETLRAPGEETEQANQDGQTLADLILTGAGPMESLPFLMSLEKKDRQEIALLLQAAKENLVAALPQRPDLLPVIDRLAPISAACEFNISAGHLSGWIAAVLS